MFDMAKLAASYLKTLTPAQIESGLPTWLRDLTAPQFEAAMRAARAEAERRSKSPAAAAAPVSPYAAILRQ